MTKYIKFEKKQEVKRARKRRLKIIKKGVTSFFGFSQHFHPRFACQLSGCLHSSIAGPSSVTRTVDWSFVIVVKATLNPTPKWTVFLLWRSLDFTGSIVTEAHLCEMANLFTTPTALVTFPRPSHPLVGYSFLSHLQL